MRLQAFKDGSARLLLLAALCVILETDARAEPRTPGEYRGVVVFDRWDACTLYNGVYLMYVSERVKEGLRASEGKAVVVNATRVFQPVNPGDGLIEEFRDLGLMPPADPRFAGRDGERLADGLALRSVVRRGKAGRAVVVATIHNEGNGPRTVHRGDLAPTLLVKLTEKPLFSPSDGPSVALVTRVSLTDLSDDGPLRERRGLWGDRRYGFTVEPALPEKFVLRPGQKQAIEFTFDLRPGEYDFLLGYGGAGHHNGPTLASRPLAFDVDADGQVKPARGGAAPDPVEAIRPKVTEVPAVREDERATAALPLAWPVEGPGLVRGRMNLEEDRRGDGESFLVPIIEIKNCTPACPVAIKLDLDGLDLRVSDEEGRVMESSIGPCSGPLVTELNGVIPQSGRGGFHTYFNSTGTPPGRTALIAGCRSWVLPPGTYRVSGTVPAEVTPVEPPPKRPETERLTLDLAPLVFRVTR